MYHKKFLFILLFVGNAHSSVLESIYLGLDLGLGVYENNSDTPDFTAYNGYVGYEINEDVSVDLGYSYFGKSENTNFYGYGYGTWLIGNYDILNYYDHKLGFSAGMASWYLEERMKNGGQRNKSQSYSPLVGISYSYRLSNSTEATLGYNYSYKVGDEVSGRTDIQWLSLGLKYKFAYPKQANSLHQVVSKDVHSDSLNVNVAENEDQSKFGTISAGKVVNHSDIDFGSPDDWSISGYDTNQIALPSEQYKSQIVMFALQLKKHSDKKIVLTGYTDDLDSKEYNELLSLQRTNVVKYWLVSEGIESDRIEVKAKGECCFKVPNISEAARMLNRRVEIKVYE